MWHSGLLVLFAATVLLLAMVAPKLYQLALSTTHIILVLQIALPPVFSTTSARNVVDTGYARYRGNLSFPNTVAYLGVPYAEPPTGDRRFRAALPLNTTRIAAAAAGAIVDATKYPDFCIQGTIGAGDAGGAGTEDCLKVNIYAPAGAKKGSKLPVLVYIHGGGYTYGNPRNWPFDHWIHQSPNVVIVSVYYRLDALGFLAVPEFADAANGDFNAGFSDQIQALKWVQQHIAAFGGDPSAVTINGESAGGSSVELHLVAATEKNLFRSAIAQSVYRTPLAKPEQRMPGFQLFAAKAGCGAGSVTDQLVCLRAADISALAIAQDFVSNNLVEYRQFQPVLDGKIFKDFPTRQILSGKFADVPIMVGSTSNETLSGGTDISAALIAFFPSLANGSVSDLVAEYPTSDFASPALQFQAATGESELLCARHIIGTAASKQNKAWTYRYNQPNPTSGGSATNHAAENWMMFQGSNTGTNGSGTFTPMTPVEISFAEELIAYWLSFVRAGDPNTFKLARSPLWTPYTILGRTRIVLQQDPRNSTTRSGSVLEVESPAEGRRCRFVASQVDVQQN
ncbi:Alpha/Beta hydrolase protein [Mycena belliarum]|uniref:Carboxylic ester hydrolase n=1 Tax=Mycena belliarum TaxID=1033014 RepID=A0AAD6UJR1_9AGAR|nr:Alpha/Beta hydrolase protein [Mycena belliae]